MSDINQDASQPGPHDEIVRLTRELGDRERSLAHTSKSLAAMFGIAEALNKATTQPAVGEGALERALDLPGVVAGWITVVDEAGNFRPLAARNLPPALGRPGAMDGLCSCRRKLLSGQLRAVTDIVDCERLKAFPAEARTFRFHTSVPIWNAERTLGVMNLIGSEDGLFSEEDRKNLYAVGNQLGVALERARLHEQLEQRTRELAAANQELESFSYSVSHDLRAPLRRINGFIGLLVEDAGDALSPEVQGHLKVITGEACRMDRLIEDLLAFSRMGRAELSESQLDLDALAQEVIRELEIASRGREIVWTVQALPRVKGDPSMVKQVFANLLGNAVKYTQPRAEARIEIGSAGEESGRAVVFVRDNGVGFDMAGQHKLFAAFQRLHRADEFEGTGIGLANVRRIVERHGGRVWAEAAPGEGATFYFTLQCR